MNNSTLSFRHDEEEMLVPNAFKPASSVAVSVVALTSVMGNILVITTFFKTKNLRISMNYYITSMAVFDLLFIITNWPLYLCSRLSIFGHSVSSFQCKLGNYLTSVSYSVSVENLVLVIVERFIAIVFPMKVSMISGRI